MKVQILSGSIRPNRQSQKVAEYLSDLFNQQDGVRAEIIDLKEYPLPSLEHSYRLHPDPTPSMNELKSKLDEADGIIFLTPEYHGSYSGVLKNTIDHFRWPFYKKPIGVVAVSAGSMGGMRAALQLDDLVIALKAYISPFKLLIDNVKETFISSNIKDPKLIERAEEFVKEFVWFSTAISNAKPAKAAKAVA